MRSCRHERDRDLWEEARLQATYELVRNGHSHPIDLPLINQRSKQRFCDLWRRKNRFVELINNDKFLHSRGFQIDKHRKQKTEITFVEPASTSTNDMKSMLAAEAGVILKKAIDDLGATDKKLLLMRAVDELTFAEIGRLLGMTKDRASRRYSKIQNQLKSQPLLRQLAN